MSQLYLVKISGHWAQKWLSYIHLILGRQLIVTLYYQNAGGYYLGGGGGGVLVNGDGPQRDSHNQGEGFGGGAGDHVNGNEWINDGPPGVILVEVGN